MTDSLRRRGREIAVRIALGAPAWQVIRQLVSEGARLAAAGTVAGMLASILLARWLARIPPYGERAAVWIWLAAPVVPITAVLLAGVLPAPPRIDAGPDHNHTRRHVNRTRPRLGAREAGRRRGRPGQPQSDVLALQEGARTTRRVRSSTGADRRTSVTTTTRSISASASAREFARVHRPSHGRRRVCGTTPRRP